MNQPGKQENLGARFKPRCGVPGFFWNVNGATWGFPQEGKNEQANDLITGCFQK